MDTFQNVDEYITSFPEKTQLLLETVRKTILQEAPLAVETIKYAMPTYVLNGNLVHFAAYKKHIGFYPTPHVIEVFANELKSFKTSKGAIQFPINEPLPLLLIARITAFRVQENKNKPVKR